MVNFSVGTTVTGGCQLATSNAKSVVPPFLALTNTEIGYFKKKNVVFCNLH